MRLLYTLPDYWPHVRRGSERLVHDLASEMARRGHEVTVVTRDPAGRGEVLREGGVTVSYEAPPHGGLVRRLRWNDVEAFSLTAFLAGLRRRCDVMHAFYWPDAWGLSLAARVVRRPLVISLHGPPGRGYWDKEEPRLHRLAMHAMGRAAAVGVISRDSARRMITEYGFAARLLVPGSDTSQFRLPRQSAERRTVVCAAAVDVGRKRIDLLLDAFARVAVDEEDLGLLLVGHGDPSTMWAQAAGFPASVRERIEHRPVTTEELPGIYAACTAGALTSEAEAFGLVVLECLAAGMPALGTDEGGIPEIISPDTGRLFPAGNATACAEQLREVLRLAEDPQTEQRCRARAAEFDWSVRGDAYEQLYQDLAG